MRDSTECHAVTVLCASRMPCGPPVEMKGSSCLGLVEAGGERHAHGVLEFWLLKRICVFDTLSRDLAVVRFPARLFNVFSRPGPSL